MTITMPLGCCDYNLTTVSGSESPLKVMLVCIIDTSHCTILPSEQKPSETFCMWGSFCLSLFFFSDLSMSPSVSSFRSLFRQHLERKPFIFSMENNSLSLSVFFILFYISSWHRLLVELRSWAIIIFFLSHYCFTTYRQGLYLFISVHSQQRKELDAWHVLNKY